MLLRLCVPKLKPCSVVRTAVCITKFCITKYGISIVTVIT